jgi:hypothetical protein
MGKLSGPPGSYSQLGVCEYCRLPKVPPKQNVGGKVGNHPTKLWHGKAGEDETGHCMLIAEGCMQSLRCTITSWGCAAVELLNLCHL